MLGPRDFHQLAVGLDHPEGVTTGPDGLIYAGGLGGQVYRIEPDGTVVELANTGGLVLGLCVDGERSVFVCDPIRRAILRISSSGEVSVWCDSAGGSPLTFPNDCAFAPDGSLWFTDSGVEDPDVAKGRLMRVPPGGGDAEVQPLRPLQFANGLCVGADGTVYFLESFGRRLSAYANGTATEIASTPHHNPDGVALDCDGGFVIASYYPFALLWIPSGQSTAIPIFEDAWGITLRMPANVSFYGEGLDQLAISNLGGFGISSVRFPVPGSSLHYPNSRAPGSPDGVP